MTSLERLREVRHRLLASGELFPVAIGPVEGEALYSRIRTEGALQTLEVGLGFGISTLFIVEGILENGSDVRHVACDPYQFAASKFDGAGLRALEEAGARDLVEFYEEESQILLLRLLAEGRSFDLAFIDGSHVFERVLSDLVHANGLVRNGGVVFIDDVQLASVRRAVEICIRDFGWQVDGKGKEGAAHHWLVARTSSDLRDASPASGRS